MSLIFYNYNLEKGGFFDSLNDTFSRTTCETDSLNKSVKPQLSRQSAANTAGRVRLERMLGLCYLLIRL